MLYKVGHHGSHNATLRTLGLEQMTSEELVAFVPVFKNHAVKNRWLEMPFEPLMERLTEKTGGRLVVSDTATEAPTTEPSLADLSEAQRTSFIRRLTVDDLFYRYSVDL